MKNKNRSSSYCNNRRRQSNKPFCNFCKCFGHSFETCYLRNNSAISIYAATVDNTESGQPMAPISAQSQSSGSTFTISRDDLVNIISNVICMNNDYKVVRISSSPLSIHEIEVYTFSSNSWRRVGFNLKPDLKFFDKDHFLPTPLVSGALHWMVVMREGEENHRDKNMIMSFDVNSEIFRKLALPHVSIDANNLHGCLASFKGKLAFITSGHGEQNGFWHSIWVMREYGVVESWNKLFVQRKDPDIQYLSSIAALMESLCLLDGANVVSY
ncbi:F-box/kelch-repeat protein At3g06240-like [Quercus lobata]|uniref:F-box/kelch-repeat protein At3g06240-like n=1 Tax=Quercus lobata TaxID=97700 RepID=UPI001245B2CE|nr:F-box/kelch-repeat protein At3g06240-like [Quercus lobata]